LIELLITGFSQLYVVERGHNYCDHKQVFVWFSESSGL